MKVIAGKKEIILVYSQKFVIVRGKRFMLFSFDETFVEETCNTKCINPNKMVSGLSNLFTCLVILGFTFSKKTYGVIRKKQNQLCRIL